MPEKVLIRLRGADSMQFAGKSLAQSLYKTPLTILLHGPLGAGKTTFMQGFASGLGISQHITSPSYALEQRYQTQKWGELIHLDLYRLSDTEAQNLVESSEDHEGIRCIEWAEKLSDVTAEHTITMQFNESDDPEERTLEITFADIALPSQKDIDDWRKEVMLPKNVVVHCDAVGAFAGELANLLIERGHVIRPLVLMRAGQLHDLFRFIDFHMGSDHLNSDHTTEQKRYWEELKQQYEGASHELVVAAFLRERGYTALASIIESHGLKDSSPKPETIEQDVLFYADKRVMLDQIVTLEERFADFLQRYGDGKETAISRIWLKECRRIEKKLFPNGIPNPTP